MSYTRKGVCMSKGSLPQDWWNDNTQLWCIYIIRQNETRWVMTPASYWIFLLLFCCILFFGGQTKISDDNYRVCIWTAKKFVNKKKRIKIGVSVRLLRALWSNRKEMNVVKKNLLFLLFIGFWHNLFVFKFENHRRFALAHAIMGRKVNGLRTMYKFCWDLRFDPRCFRLWLSRKWRKYHWFFD